MGTYNTKIFQCTILVCETYKLWMNEFAWFSLLSHEMLNLWCMEPQNANPFFLQTSLDSLLYSSNVNTPWKKKTKIIFKVTKDQQFKLF